MKKENLNGQVLSEKEMREVKGGMTYDIDAETLASGVVKYCMACGHPFGGTYTIDENGFVVCPNCSCRTPIDDIKLQQKNE